MQHHIYTPGKQWLTEITTVIAWGTESKLKKIKNENCLYCCLFIYKYSLEVSIILTCLNTINSSEHLLLVLAFSFCALKCILQAFDFVTDLLIKMSLKNDRDFYHSQLSLCFLLMLLGVKFQRGTSLFSVQCSWFHRGNYESVQSKLF